MTSADSLWNYATFCLVTGGGRGLGRSIAANLGKKFCSGSVVFILGRNEKHLLEAKDAISTETAPGVRIQHMTADLCMRDSYDDLFPTMFYLLHIQPSDFKQAMIVHNAGSVGNLVSKAAEQDSVVEVRHYFDLNVSSVVSLNASFFKHFPQTVVPRLYVLNISSLCAIEPHKGMSLYCTGKAARDMYFRVLADEQPDARVLSYAPGPLRTAMTDYICQHVSDLTTKKMFNDMVSRGDLLECDHSVEKLLRILHKDTFTSGSHIDFYDED